MKYALIIDGKVEQVQPNEEIGFVEVDDEVVCGMVKEGVNFIIPVQPIIVIAPTVITPLQARVALSEIGIRQAVEDAMITATQDIKDFYEFALEWKRDNAQLLTMATSLGMDSVDIDNFFLLANMK